MVKHPHKHGLNEMSSYSCHDYDLDLYTWITLFCAGLTLRLQKYIYLSCTGSILVQCVSCFDGIISWDSYFAGMLMTEPFQQVVNFVGVSKASNKF